MTRSRGLGFDVAALAAPIGSAVLCCWLRRRQLPSAAALEGAAGSAGRTESTSKVQAVQMMASSSA
ncbi:MAG TPA: hypothetical protein VMD59_24630 [Acidimicrobiales bacterium]|nr:hypothetical protein [Acidimicrobiales bacterium]